MRRDPTVSVVIPAYNAARYLGAAISSALYQTYPHVSVVVVDDGSSDNTATIAEAYGGRVRVIRQSNAGPSSARNAGIAAGDSDLIAFCDSDDVLMPNHIETAVRTIAAAGDRAWVTSASWLLTDAGVVARKRDFYYGTPRPEEQVAAILDANFVAILSTFPRAMIDEVGGFDESMVWCEDWDLWLRAILRGWRVRFVRDRTALYRMTPGSLSSHGPGMAQGHKTLLRKTLEENRDRLTVDQQETLCRRLDEPSYMELNRSAKDALHCLDLKTAKSLYRQSALANPRDLTVRRRARMLRLYPSSDNAWARPISKSLEAALAWKTRDS